MRVVDLATLPYESAVWGSKQITLLEVIDLATFIFILVFTWINSD